jgi:hypothetical protein
MSVPAKERPVFLVRLRAEPGINPIRAMRAALKVLASLQAARDLNRGEQHR